MTINNTKRPTQSDVAKLANVSRATVSFVLSEKEQQRIPISEETKRRVFEAARALNYSPDPVAQMLASGNNHLVGVFSYERLFPMQRDDFYYEFLLGIEMGASTSGYNVILFTRDESSNGERLVFPRGHNQLRLADGTIFLGSQPNRNELSRLMDENYPFVHIGKRDVPGKQISWVACDYMSGSERITDHLARQGHHNYAYIGPKEHNESNLDKLAGIDRALSRYEQCSIRKYDEELLKSGKTISEIEGLSFCTAILCSYETTFHHVVDFLFRNGRKIPDDHHVVSLANISDYQQLSFSPTYLHVNRPMWGEKAFSTLLEILDTPAKSPLQIRIPCDIVYGD